VIMSVHIFLRSMGKRLFQYLILDYVFCFIVMLCEDSAQITKHWVWFHVGVVSFWFFILGSLETDVQVLIIVEFIGAVYHKLFG
jgi:hypothetical protein